MTDHKAEAEGRLDILNGNDYTGGDSEAAIAAAMAQVSATLYLAEQQRIANLIAMVQDAEMIDPIKGKWEDGFWEDARKVIVEGLGLA